MGNLITIKAVNQDIYLNISNGSMSALISALALSGSSLAKEDFQIKFMIWIVSRDQGILGMGTVGFDLEEMPWSNNEAIFNQQKAFMLKVIQRVRLGLDLHLLSYEPQFLGTHIETFKILVESFLFSHVNPDITLTWMPPKETQLRCAMHGAARTPQSMVRTLR